MLAAAALIAPIVFTMLVVVQGLLQPDYSHIAQPISALAAGPRGWIQNVNFFVLGCSIVGFAIGLHLGVRRGRGGTFGPALLALSGIGLLMAAAFPWERPGEDFVVPTAHVVGAVLTFLGAGTGLTVLSRRMSADPEWRTLGSYTFASGIAIVILFLLTGIARAEDAPLHRFFGLLQRLVLAVWFPCVIVLAVRLWRMSNAAVKRIHSGEIEATPTTGPSASA